MPKALLEFILGIAAIFIYCGLVYALIVHFGFGILSGGVALALLIAGWFLVESGIFVEILVSFFGKSSDKSESPPSKNEN